MMEPEAFIEMRRWYTTEGKTVAKPTLVISIDELLDVLVAEAAILDPKDAGRLAMAFSFRAAPNSCTTSHSLDKWDTVATAEIQDDEEYD